MTDKNQEVKPRFEFRVFGQGLGHAAALIRRRAPCENIEEVYDLYCLASGSGDNNVKIRGGSLGVKQRFGTEKRLELWQPAERIEFPAPVGEAAGLISRTLSMRPMEYPDIELTADEFIDRVLRAHPSILLAEVAKRRFHFRIGKCMVEIVEMLVNGAAIQSIGVESEEVSAVENILAEIGLEEYENVNYPRAIARIMGLLPLPERNWPGVGGCWNG